MKQPSNLEERFVDDIGTIIEIYELRKKIRREWEQGIERRLAIIEQHLEIFRPRIKEKK